VPFLRKNFAKYGSDVFPYGKSDVFSPEEEKVMCFPLENVG